ncbi:hypothetical protein PENVUL_c012G06924 [Penicillium vulpinum]|uniref:Uncharacterized protein n=1 Tax=Penicillium vulpinum TaxID=29845 RepID=A0A1V6S1R5_9EURO|nr:hypothetical protein PENVUL_c012G06924 [Penicillium vulpinum]
MVPKRVILRLQESNFPRMSYSDIVECVKCFLAYSGRLPEETEQGWHFWHLQPPSPVTPQANPRFHIIIDINRMEHSGPLDEQFPHEIYRVSRVENEIKQEHDNFLRKLRHFSDDFYPWGEEKRRAVSGSSA